MAEDIYIGWQYWLFGSSYMKIFVGVEYIELGCLVAVEIYDEASGSDCKAPRYDRFH